MGIIFVALGGALGALCRYAISLIQLKSAFPFLTLLTNLLGALLIGFIAGLSQSKDNISPNAVLFWKTGVCGGFTTFSTFSLESVSLIERGAYICASAYIAASVALCIIGVICGKKLSMLGMGNA